MGLCVAVFLLVVLLTRYVSLGSVVSITLLPLLAGLLGAPLAVIIAAAGTAVLVMFKHLENLKRLARGEERRLGSK